MQLVSLIATLFSILVPAQVWIPGDKPINISVKAETPVTLMLTEFTGRIIEPKGDANAAPGANVDVRSIFPQVKTPGTYVLWAVPQGKKLPEFVGTPIVISVRNDTRPGAPKPDQIVVTKLEPLSYGVITTDKGAITCMFYYDVAPNTVDAITGLAQEGFYDGLSFHRIMPGFVIQGGDPLGDGTGGPGFNINAEFNSRKHEAGTLSMARNGDPMEAQGLKPRAEFKNSAGSQFFICLEAKEHLDGSYTAFGKVASGMDVVKAIGAVEADKQSGKPKGDAPTIQKFEIKPVTASEFPYKSFMIFIQ